MEGSLLMLSTIWLASHFTFAISRYSCAALRVERGAGDARRGEGADGVRETGSLLSFGFDCGGTGRCYAHTAQGRP